MHRASWEIHVGAIPEKMEVCHKCDNPACWNPKHLFLGSHTDNMRDALAKGRLKPLKGSDHSQAKLTEAQVRQIRAEYKKGLGPVLAKRFGVNRNTITMIAARIIWRHL